MPLASCHVSEVICVWVLPRNEMIKKGVEHEVTKEENLRENGSDNRHLLKRAPCLKPGFSKSIYLLDNELSVSWFPVLSALLISSFFPSQILPCLSHYLTRFVMVIGSEEEQSLMRCYPWWKVGALSLFVIQLLCRDTISFTPTSSLTDCSLLTLHSSTSSQ